MKVLKSLLFVTLFLVSTSMVLADGTEKLGPPSISLKKGSGVVVAGTGLLHQPGDIHINVPSGTAVKQVLLYWNQFTDSPSQADDTVKVKKGSTSYNVKGLKIGGGTHIFNLYDVANLPRYSHTFRADITNLNFVSSGSNTIEVSELGGAYAHANNGAGILVIYDDGQEREIVLRDGDDWAFLHGIKPETSPRPELKKVEKQRLNFKAENFQRTAKLSFFLASVKGDKSGSGPERPHSLEITVNGSKQVITNPFGSSDGDEWDSAVFDVIIPANVSFIDVELFSRKDYNTNKLEASLLWVAVALHFEYCPTPTPTPTPKPTKTPTPKPTATPTPKPTTTPKPTPTPLPPLCDAGGPYIKNKKGELLECSKEPQKIQLDAGSSKNSVTYKWTTDCPNAYFSSDTAKNPVLTLDTFNGSSSTGISCKVYLSVENGNGNHSKCEAPVTSSRCEVDCEGNPDGNKIPDACGVCGGDGSSCGECENFNIQGIQLSMDSNAAAQRNNVFQLSYIYRQAARLVSLSSEKEKKVKEDAKAANRAAQESYEKAWQTVYTSIPGVMLTCDATPLCVNVSIAGAKGLITSHEEDILAIGEKIGKKARKLLKRAVKEGNSKAKKLTKKLKGYLESNIDLFMEGQELRNKLPDFTSSCQ